MPSTSPTNDDTNVHFLEGGMQAWQEARLPTEQPRDA
jgi:3-mercaptopyruvate sulfurtransferase SseA